MSDAPDCTCGHANYAHDYRYGTCYETGEGRCSCYAYRPAAAEGNETCATTGTPEDAETCCAYVEWTTDAGSFVARCNRRSGHKGMHRTVFEDRKNFGSAQWE